MPLPPSVRAMHDGLSGRSTSPRSASPVRSPAEAIQLQNVVCRAHERPFSLHLLESTQQELPEATGLLDLRQLGDRVQALAWHPDDGVDAAPTSSASVDHDSGEEGGNSRRLIPRGGCPTPHASTGNLGLDRKPVGDLLRRPASLVQAFSAIACNRSRNQNAGETVKRTTLAGC